MGVSPQVAEGLLNQLEQRMSEMSMMGYTPVLLVAPELRRPVRNLISRFLPQLIVISHKEVEPGVSVSTDGEVGYDLVRMAAPATEANYGDVTNMEPTMV